MKQLYTQFFIVFVWLLPSQVMARGESVGSGVFKDSFDTQSFSQKDTNENPNALNVIKIGSTKFKLSNDSVAVKELAKYPLTSLQQVLKGATSGVYVQQSSGEPGTIKENMTIRGISRPILNAKNFSDNKPLVIVNGIPLIEDPNLVYDIQNSENTPVGAATNIFSLMDLDNIQSIHVLKDPSTTAIYGPRAANGVIYVTTKNASSGDRRISINGYTGFATPPSLYTINAEFERDFRQPFYDRYATEAQKATYPSYLSDSSNVNYYGPSNWVEEYYRTTPIYSLNGSLEGGGDRSNFRFFANHMKNANSADDTKLKRYMGAFYVNMIPTTWLKVTGNIQLGRLERGRNRSLTERFAETNFVPNLSTPFAPNKSLYSKYLYEYDKKSFDDNINTSLLGLFSLDFRLAKDLNFMSRISMDYNENRRDLFWPSTLMTYNNYASNYFGYNERLSFDNVVNYRKELGEGSIFLEGGFSVQADKQKYNYIQAYRGPNDYIKINKVSGDKNKAEYLQSIGFIPYLYTDKTQHRLISGFLKGTYSHDSGFDVSALFRRDGSSLYQASKRWFNSFAFDAKYDINKLIGSDGFDYLKASASYGRMGNLPLSDMEAAGLQYSSALGWDGNKAVLSYNGIGTISRPYSFGWVGYDIPWSYQDVINLGLSLQTKSNFGANIEYYQKQSHNVLFPIPTVAESGYKFEYSSGMAVKNNGVDLTLNYSLPTDENKFGWNSSFNISYNTNELTKLPKGFDELVVGKNKLKVGERVDAYWLLENQGIYANDLDVPVRGNDFKIMTYNGVDMKGGDPRWLDRNNDFDINNDDRKLMGNILPKWTGGFMNQFTYKNFDLSFLLYFNMKRDILNQNAARYYDFVNVSESTSLAGVREITYWEKHFDTDKYPLYNPWSSVSPYQVEQDMFLEDGSFLKLKNLSLGYDLTKVLNNKKVQRAYVYVTGSNLLTITKYSGRDPELVNYYGYDTGAGLGLDKTFTLGFKLDF